jgi:hypothetical protein
MLLVAGILMTLLWIGFLGFLGYGIAFAILGDHG